jgi:hypothetical protein
VIAFGEEKFSTIRRIKMPKIVRMNVIFLMGFGRKGLN